MPAFAIDLDEIAPLGEVVDHCLFQIQLATQLVEVGHFQLGTVLDGATGGLELAEHQLQQGTFAGAIVANQANTVTAQDIGGEVAHQWALARPGETDLLQLDNALARGIGSFHLKTGLALTLDALGALLAHGLERAHPTFVAGTPGLDTLADPHLFLRQLLVEQRIGRGFRRQLLLLVFKKAAVVALPVDQLAAIQFHDACGQRLQELTVVGDEQHRAAEFQQHLFQPGDGMNVQVVGRLVEQQYVGLTDQRLGQQHPATPATRQLGHGFFSR